MFSGKCFDNIRILVSLHIPRTQFNAIQCVILHQCYISISFRFAFRKQRSCYVACRPLSQRTNLSTDIFIFRLPVIQHRVDKKLLSNVHETSLTMCYLIRLHLRDRVALAIENVLSLKNGIATKCAPSSRVCSLFITSCTPIPINL